MEYAMTALSLTNADPAQAMDTVPGFEHALVQQNMLAAFGSLSRSPSPFGRSSTPQPFDKEGYQKAYYIRSEMASNYLVLDTPELYEVMQNQLQASVNRFTAVNQAEKESLSGLNKSLSKGLLSLQNPVLSSALQRVTRDKQDADALHTDSALDIKMRKKIISHLADDAEKREKSLNELIETFSADPDALLEQVSSLYNLIDTREHFQQIAEQERNSAGMRRS
jgi:hypothetical protein